MESYFPFNSVSGDRTYSAESFSGYFGELLSSGVSANGDNLPVTSAGGLAVSVGSGYAWLSGHLYQNNATKTLTLSAGDALPRVDRIVTRLMVAERMITTMTIEGTPATTPTAPDLVRTDDYWDICLAEIYVASSAITITDANITDTRTDDDLCGVIRCLAENLSVEDFMKNCQSEFDQWFETLQDILSGDVAGNLQNEIETNGEAINTHAKNTNNPHAVTGEQVELDTDASTILGGANVQTALLSLATQITGKPSIAYGTYIGTGTYGSDNPNQLTFDFVPKLLIVSGETLVLDATSNAPIVWVHGVYIQRMGSASTNPKRVFAENGNTVSWYISESAIYQLNTLNEEYYYIALGVGGTT